MQLFYCTNISGGIAVFNEEESIHCIRVLRMKHADEVFFVDGRGGFYKGIITEAHAQKCKVQIVESKQDFEKRGYHLHIAIAPTKNIQRFEWFLEKATEIGVDEITPLICMHSERREVKTERLKKVLLSAMKQSLKAYLPVVHEKKSFEEFVSSVSDLSGDKFICQKSDETSSLMRASKKGSNNIVVIGPEGDFTEEEIELAKRDNFKKVSLGNSRLRTETAGVVAATVVSMVNQ